MELTEAQMIEKYAKQCKHCLRNTFLLYESEYSCVVCSYNVTKQKKRT